MKAAWVSSLIILSLLIVACSKTEVSTSSVPSETAQASAKGSCTDSDGGKNYTQFGTVAYTENGKNYNISDECVNYIYLVEAYCDDQGIGKTENYICKNECDVFENQCF